MGGGGGGGDGGGCGSIGGNSQPAAYTPSAAQVSGHRVASASVLSLPVGGTQFMFADASAKATSCSMVTTQGSPPNSAAPRLIIEAQLAEPKPPLTVNNPKASKAPLLSEHKGGALLWDG